MTEIPVRHLQAIAGTAADDVAQAFSDGLIRDAASARVRAERAEQWRERETARADKAEQRAERAEMRLRRLFVLAQAMTSALSEAPTATRGGPGDVW